MRWTKIAHATIDVAVGIAMVSFVAQFVSRAVSDNDWRLRVFDALLAAAAAMIYLQAIRTHIHRHHQTRP